MEKVSLLLVITFLATIMVAEAQTQSETRSLRGFSSVKIANSIDAQLVKGDKNAIDIVASGIDLDKVETNVSDNTLEVKLVRGNFRSSSVKVVISYVDINEVQASTSAKVIVQDVLEGDNVYLFANTSSYIEAQVNAGTLHAEAATNAKVFVSGSADDLQLKAFTSAEIDGKKLQVKNADIQANTAAKAEFGVSESIAGTAATAAKVFYHGDPKIVDIKTNTGGDIRKK